MVISFRQWLELATGPGSGGVPVKQRPDAPELTQALQHAYGPGSDETPPTPERKEILKSKKKMKKEK